MLDNKYLTRFWPQFEAFLGFQAIGEDGRLTPLGARRSRADIVDLEIDTKNVLRKQLLRKWSTATVDDAIDYLARPRVVVTNGKDKVRQLAKLMELRELVSSVMASASTE